MDREMSVQHFCCKSQSDYSGCSENNGLQCAITGTQFQTHYWNVLTTCADLREPSTCYQCISAYHPSAPLRPAILFQ